MIDTAMILQCSNENVFSGVLFRDNRYKALDIKTAFFSEQCKN